MNERAIFEAALDQKDEKERSAYLNDACGADEALRQQIEGLLKAHEMLGSFLLSPPSAPGETVDEPITERPGTVIGPYRLMEQIGEGGMGLVFVAEQQYPVRRKVALKVIKPGMDTRQVIARFEAERQALALMDHPNIAKVLDGGTTGHDYRSGSRETSEPGSRGTLTSSAGRPYFVMELVKGVPITEYCDQNRVPIRERLELFLDVCQAVQHAHQKGIIHRDIKPSNVLVVSNDGTPLVKVIDFGIAKAIGQQLTDKTIYTQFTQLVGTPLYMSPEQAGQSGVDIDTRTDIYALGVMLYELLTGTTPFDKERLHDAGYDEIRRIIREEEPPRPSTRLRKDEGGRMKDETRRTKRTRWDWLLPFSSFIPHPSSFQELDWIVMKALEKDRNRRYETANGFAMDVQRYLADEPVQACPPSAWYRFRKFARRNRAAMLALAAALAFIVVGGAAIWSWQLRRVEQNYHAELTRRSVESSLEQLKELHRRALWQQAETLLQHAEHQLGTQGGGELRQRVAQARRDTAFIKRLDDIRLEASVIVGGKWNRAAALPKYRDAFIENGLDILKGDPVELAAKLRASEVWDYVLAALDDWAMEEDSKNRQRIMSITAEATGQAWRRQLSAFWEDGIRFAEVYDAIPEQERTPAIIGAAAFRLGQVGQDGIRRLEQGLRQYRGDFWLHIRLGQLQWKHRPDIAIGANRAALALRPGTLAALNNLGMLLDIKKQYDAAIAEYKEAIRLDPTFAQPHTGLGDVRRAKKQYDAAIAEYKEAIRLDPTLAQAHHGLGNVLCDKKDYDAAIAAYKQAIRLDPTLAQAHHGLGNVLCDKKDYDAAIAAYKQAIRLDPTYAKPHTGLGNVRRDKKEYEAAISEYKQAIRLDPTYGEPHTGLGNVRHDRKEYEAAIAEYKEAILLDPTSALPHNGLGNVLHDKKEYDAAIKEYEYAICLDPTFAHPHHGLGNVLRDKKEYDAAIARYREAIRLDPGYDEANCALGGVYLDQGRFEEAFKFLKRGHELGSQRTGWPYPSGQWLKHCQRLLVLDHKLAAVLRGEAQPGGWQERLDLATLCRIYKQQHDAAAAFYAEAFAENPKAQEQLRYMAATSAARAGAGQSKDAPKLDNKERANLRQKALAWLRDELQAGQQALQKDPTFAALLPEQLKHWQSDPDLFSVRDAKELAKLPEAEQPSWRELWREVDQLSKKATAAFAELIVIKGRLTAGDREQVQEVKMVAGITYVIDIASKDFDAHLRLETGQKKVLAENDDIAPDNLNSRIIFTPKEDGLYRIIATSYQQAGIGAYTLCLREFQRKKE